MLFDLRGRGRRRTVQVVYLGLAILIGAGLVLFGVGTGTGGGGLLNGVGGTGSGNQNSVVSQQEKAALKQVKANPSNPAAYSALVQARWTSAGQGDNFNSNTGQFTAAGKKKLAQTTQAWEKYVTLTKTPDPNLAVLAARAYAAQGNYGGAASAWELETASSPNTPKGYECLAVSAYAAKQTRKGDLAMAKAIDLVPKAQRALLKTQIQSAKTNPQIAQQC
jgi:predicted Zn-dependent protease